MADYSVIIGDIWAEYAPFIILGIFFLGAFTIRWWRNRKMKRQATASVGKAPMQSTPLNMPPRGMPQQGLQQPQNNPYQYQQQPATPAPQQPAQAARPKPKPEFNYNSKFEKDFRSIFSEVQIPPTEEELIYTMTDIARKMEKATEDIDKNLDVELHNLSARLVDVNRRKEQIRRYGQQLAKLFETYDQQEQQLATTVTNLEKMVAKQKRIKEEGQRLDNMP